MPIRQMAEYAANLYNDTTLKATRNAPTGVTGTVETPNSPAPAPTGDTMKPDAVVQLSPGAQFFARIRDLASAAPAVRLEVIARARDQAALELTPTEISSLAAKLLQP